MSDANYDKPRQQYYTYAHRLLPMLFFDKPDMFMKIMRHPNALDFLRSQWDMLSKHTGNTDPYTGLDYETRALEDGTFIAIITLPPPVTVTEAYYVAAVYRPAVPDLPPVIRYFTLEFGASFDPSAPQRRVLCEWLKTPQHMNYGGQDAPDQAGFLRLIIGKLDQPTGAGLHAAMTPPRPQSLN